MFWGCVTARGTGNIAQVDGRMGFGKHQQILEANMSVRRLKQKIHLIHNINYIKKHKLKLSEWPSQSPDLDDLKHARQPNNISVWWRGYVQFFPLFIRKCHLLQDAQKCNNSIESFHYSTNTIILLLCQTTISNFTHFTLTNLTIYTMCNMYL